MPKLDRDTARALTDAGYMPLAEYIEEFGDEPSMPRAPAEQVLLGDHRVRRWSVPPHFTTPTRGVQQPQGPRRRRA